jgi:hypothetical protein
LTLAVDPLGARLSELLAHEAGLARAPGAAREASGAGDSTPSATGRAGSCAAAAQDATGARAGARGASASTRRRSVRRTNRRQVEGTPTAGVQREETERAADRPAAQTIR